MNFGRCVQMHYAPIHSIMSVIERLMCNDSVVVSKSKLCKLNVGRRYCCYFIVAVEQQVVPRLFYLLW